MQDHPRQCPDSAASGESYLDEHRELRFDWVVLPAATDGLPGTGGQTRMCLDDFAVSEIPRFPPSGEGGYAYAFVEKRGLTTHDLIAALREAGVPYNDVGFAGLKDKYAVTRQWLSVPERFAAQLESLDGREGVRVLEISRHTRKLGRGHLRGNRFEIRVRAPVEDWRPRAEVALQRLESIGLPNYFGPQRFGRFNSNAIDAVRVLRGENVPGGRRLGEFFVSALQSHLFNWNLKRRMELGLYAAVLDGDRAQRHDTGGAFLVDDPAAETERAQALEISPLLPLYGRKVSGNLGAAERIEREVLEHFGLTRTLFRRAARGAWRISRVRLEDLALEATEDGYTVGVTLPNGAYATCLLRELTKVEDAPQRQRSVSSRT